MRKFLIFALLLAMAAAAQALEVKILLIEAKNNITIKASGPFTISADKKKYKVSKGGSFKISREGKNLKIGTVETTGPAEITLAQEGSHFTLNGNQYNGTLIVRSAKAGGVNIIERIDFEDYLYGVLPYEMSHSWPLEALKAQAVAARTYTLKTIEDKKMKEFDLYSDVRSQMYKGSVKIYDSVKQAVDGTKGQVLKYNGALFYTYYHANCGGHTDEISWAGGTESPKPLQGAVCSYCDGGAGAKWKYTVPQADIEKFLAKQGMEGSVKSIKVGDKHKKSGRAKNLVFTTSKQKKTLNCNTFRLAIGSTKFKSCMITSVNKFTFEGKGYGHGRGLCQEGAKGMAQAGKSYKDILTRYYPSSTIKSVD